MRWIMLWAASLAALFYCNKPKKQKENHEPRKDTVSYTSDAIVDFFSKRYGK